MKKISIFGRKERDIFEILFFIWNYCGKSEGLPSD
jgi:hypothetical protein